MSDTVRPLPGILNIKPYIGGEDIIPKGYTCKVLLSSNENPFGPSLRVLQVIKDAAKRAHVYPSGSSRILKEAIAEFHGLDKDRILCTNGSEDGLTLLIRTFAGVGDEVLFSAHAFSLYGIVSLAVGATPVAAPARKYNIDVDALLAAVSPRTKIVILDNPRNPIGSYIGRDEVLRLRQNLPDHVLLVLDSAYAEYMTAEDYTAGIDLVDQFDNVVMTRTFSKFYALAGLRLGWMYGPAQIIDWVNRIRAPFCCNSGVQEAGIAALVDVEHQDLVRHHQQTMLPWFMDKLGTLGLNYVPSVTNFVLVEFESEGPFTADAVYLRLAEDGYIVRPVKGYGLPNHLRITLGAQKDMEAVVSILESFLDDYLPKYGITA